MNKKVRYDVQELKPLMVKEDEVQLIYKVRKITSDGHNAEIKVGKDGRLQVMEITREIK